MQKSYPTVYSYLSGGEGFSAADLEKAEQGVRGRIIHELINLMKRFSRLSRGEILKKQEALLRGVANVVRPGGRLVYMTCSLEREENELQVETFLEIHPAFRRECEDLFVFPPDAGTDGAFAARLVRTG